MGTRKELYNEKKVTKKANIESFKEVKTKKQDNKYKFEKKIINWQ